MNAAKGGVKTKIGWDAIKSTLFSTWKIVKKNRGKSEFQTLKILTSPEVQGDILPLIPIFAGFSAWDHLLAEFLKS